MTHLNTNGRGFMLKIPNVRGFFELNDYATTTTICFKSFRCRMHSENTSAQKVFALWCQLTNSSTVNSWISMVFFFGFYKKKQHHISKYLIDLFKWTENISDLFELSHSEKREFNSFQSVFGFEKNEIKYNFAYLSRRRLIMVCTFTGISHLFPKISDFNRQYLMSCDGWCRKAFRFNKFLWNDHEFPHENAIRCIY